MTARGALTLLIAILLAAHAVRTAAVRGDPGGLGQMFWPGHPQVETWQLMGEIGARARQGKGLTQPMVERTESIARKAPLAVEPLLIKGALAQMREQEDQAERLFAEAARRNPRSEAARYFLAERYLRTGRMTEALDEMAALSRLIPGAAAQFAPALAQFAQTAGAVPPLRAFLRQSPEFEAPTLFELSRSPANADLILALWSGSTARPEPDWRVPLINALVGEQQYAKAHAVWRRLAGTEFAGGLFNPGFRKLAAPPPFNWRFSASGGVAEPGPTGLQVVYFGRQDTILAEQLLILRPGRYQLGMTVSGGGGDAPPLRWTLECLPAGSALAELPLKPAPRIGVAFNVPASCPAQRLRLVGEAPEFPRSTEVTVRDLGLQEASGR